MIRFRNIGNFERTSKYLKFVSEKSNYSFLEELAKKGLQALKDSTPKRTGKTSESWVYSINVKKNKVEILWDNNNVVDHVNIAVILDTGHGTRNGGYVVGTHYIDPTLTKVFEEIADQAWKGVTSI